MGLFILVVAFLLEIAVWQSEASIRISGFVLQLIGMLLAIRGLLLIRAHFRQPLLRDLLIKWIKRFPNWKGRVVRGAGVAAAMNATGTADLTAWTPDNPEHSLEKRVDAIVENLSRLRESQSQQNIILRELKGSHEKHIKETAEETQRLEKDLRADLESLHTSDIVTSLVGLVLLTFGIFLSTLAPELHFWLHHT
ncbi:hypothetical protein OOT55_02745 [Marinimicrobium sp. C6131]|uniref:hypothetical protein n=1 Tax=Marinimicrobium sp. C6131 TaxID=3022676 RepID=UPI00223E0758|nr:hypothetical protein [Marinimicrobium sp. C6131]UZJ44991.1 hypothetical protein OOT55_02745 [Marinimicrobium sp. C6131]